MNPVIKVVAAPIVTGNQDITTTDLDGLTPKGALFIYARAGSNGTVVADSGSSFGAADASGNQWAFGSVCEDDVATSFVDARAWSSAKSDKCITAVEGIATHSEAAFVTFITEGVRINWTTVDAADAWLLTVVFFAGDDWECKVGNWVAGTPPTNVALGWEPTCVLVGGSSRPFGTPGGNLNMCFGANGWDSSGVRGGFFGLGWANTGTGQRVTWTQGTHTSQSSGVKFTTFGYANTVTRTATTMSVVETGVFAADGWGYMALKWDGRFARFGNMPIAATTGDQAFTGFGLIPKFVLLIPTQNTGFATAALTNRSMGLVAINADKSAGWAHQAVHSANPSKENSIALEDSIQLLAKAGDGAVDSVCTVAGLQADGMTFNFTTADFSLSPGQTHYWSYMALGPITEDEDEEPTTGALTFAAIID